MVFHLHSAAYHLADCLSTSHWLAVPELMHYIVTRTRAKTQSREESCETT